jgi:hypothetical protein
VTGRRRLHRLLALLVSAAAAAALPPLGCRQVLGIHDLGSDALTCDTYCDTITTACPAPRLQYESRGACMALCATMPVGTLQDQSGDTLGCRLALATQISWTGEGDCAAAGPAGAGQCGGDCDSFCQGALLVCPSDFASAADCLQKCNALPSCEPYSVPSTPPDTNSVQCRIYHLTAATLDPGTHCPHVAGNGFCRPDSPPCTPGDAGGD